MRVQKYDCSKLGHEVTVHISEIIIDHKNRGERLQDCDGTLECGVQKQGRGTGSFNWGKCEHPNNPTSKKAKP